MLVKLTKIEKIMFNWRKYLQCCFCESLQNIGYCFF